MAQAQTMMTLGHEAQLDGRPEDAERAFRAVLAEDPDNQEALHRLGTLLLQAGRAGEAEELIREVADSGSADPAVWVNLGNALRLQGRFQEAIKNFERAVDLEPRSVGGWLGLGQCLRNAGDLDRAEEYLGYAYDLAPEDFGVLRALADLFTHTGRAGRACALYRRCLEQSPGRPGLLLRLAQALVALNEHQQALQELEKIAPEAPQYPDGLRLKAGIGLMLNRPGFALQNLNALSEDQGGQPEAVLLRGRAEAARGNTSEAVNLFRDLVRQYPRWGTAWYQLCSLAPEVISDRDLAGIREFARERDREGAPPAWFALARVHAYREEWDREFQALKHAQRPAAERGRQRAEALLHSHGRIRRELTEDWFRSLAAALQPESHLRPLFILGLPAGGRASLHRFLRSRLATSGTPRRLLQANLGWPAADNVSLSDRFGAAWRDQLAAELNQLLSGNQQGEPVVFVDSADHAAWFAGPIRALLPGARFLVLHRHPLDQLTELFRRSFERKPAWATRPEDIARVMESFEGLLAHWRTLLPEPLLELDFEHWLEAPEDSLDWLVREMGWQDALSEAKPGDAPVPAPKQVGVDAWRRYAGELEEVRQRFFPKHS